MPNRVDANANNMRPQSSGPARQANGQPQQGEQAQSETQNPNQADRVEISSEARARAEATRPRAGAAPQEVPDTQAGQQGVVNQATEVRAEELREGQQQARREATGPAPEQQGNLVDVVG